MLPRSALRNRIVWVLRVAAAATVLALCACTDSASDCGIIDSDRLELTITSPVTFDTLTLNWGCGLALGPSETLPKAADMYRVVYLSDFHPDLPHCVAVDAKLNGQLVAHGKLDNIPPALEGDPEHCDYLSRVQLQLSAM